VYLAHNLCSYSRDKISALVDFPLKDFDLGPFLSRPEANTVYDLFAVSNHMGGLGGGHCAFRVTRY
jgi:ubiquitin carboxyl-terminal hydrolase 4/11